MDGFALAEPATPLKPSSELLNLTACNSQACVAVLLSTPQGGDHTPNGRPSARASRACLLSATKARLLRLRNDHNTSVPERVQAEAAVTLTRLQAIAQDLHPWPSSLALPALARGNRAILRGKPYPKILPRTERAQCPLRKGDNYGMRAYCVRVCSALVSSQIGVLAAYQPAPPNMKQHQKNTAGS